MGEIVDLVPVKQSESQRVESVFMPVMSMDVALSRRATIVEFTKKIMVPDQDFGVIPGTGKPSLLKPGAEKLCCFFGLEPEFTPLVEDADWTGDAHKGEPFYYVRYRCRLLRDGRVLGVGEGSCNSWESKYRWRQGERKCPQCGQSAIIAGKEEYGGGWLCFKRKGGCGQKFAVSDPKITSQQVGRVPNPDIADVVNTIQKMGQKRALVAATLIATSASEFFTQDTEDMPREPIDTGGAPMNTQEAANSVRDRRINELKPQTQTPERSTPEVPATAASVGSGGLQTTTAPVVENPAPVEPAEVRALWNKMGTKPTAIRAVLAEVYGDLAELIGVDEADVKYKAVCQEFAGGDPNVRVSFARRVVFEMWKLVQTNKQPVEPVHPQDVLFETENKELVHAN